MPEINLYNGDCMEAMAKMKDNAFQLAICDVPYGIGEGNKDKGRNGFGVYKKRNSYESKDWDKSAPPKKYFNELKRVSQNQIIWGANHFIENIPFANSSAWIVWDKVNGATDFADSELAYTSFKKAVRNFVFQWSGMLQGDMKNKEARIHPTQKPVKLYKWLLGKYAKEGDKILDTHGGSMSIAIACHDLKFDLDLYEIDKDYFEAGKKRLKQHTDQMQMF